VLILGVSKEGTEKQAKLILSGRVLSMLWYSACQKRGGRWSTLHKAGIAAGFKIFGNFFVEHFSKHNNIL